MKRIYSFIIMVALLITAFAISGCFPPNYSKEQAKKIVKNLKLNKVESTLATAEDKKKAEKKKK